MNIEMFQQLITAVTDFIAPQPIEPTLAQALNQQFPANSEYFSRIEAACQAGIAAGWMCTQGAAGRRFGRVIEPCEETSGFSIDVVDLTNIVGPHHRHPLGEVCMVFPITPGALFDAVGRGWCVYPPGSAHSPTVTQGEALILYMLPKGQIEFRR
tara:strand:+ start:842 stop:1306 length:465 start_codon:yes stop_codon:yes gene_type:complete